MVGIGVVFIWLFLAAVASLGAAFLGLIAFRAVMFGTLPAAAREPLGSGYHSTRPEPSEQKGKGPAVPERAHARHEGIEGQMV